jgi:hypothetical protein
MAVPVAEDGVTVCRASGNREGEASALRWLGTALCALGEDERARWCWRDALALYSLLGMSEAAEVQTLLDQPTA